MVTENPSNISIRVNVESLSSRRNITGEVWLDVSGRSFPAERWSDFPVIILGWWLEALTDLWAGRRRSAECLFMDGSYSFEAIGDRGGDWLVRCLEDTLSGKRCDCEAVVNPLVLLKEVEDAAALVLEECRRRGWRSQDTENLEAALSQIRGEMSGGIGIVG